MISTSIEVLSFWKREEKPENRQTDHTNQTFDDPQESRKSVLFSDLMLYKIYSSNDCA